MEPLNRQERITLMSLLELSPEAFGDWGLMSHKYRKAAKRFHPDKGGDPEKMAMLNCYMAKYQAYIGCSSDLTDSPVSHFLDLDFYTLGEWLGERPSLKLCRDPLWCPKTCGCSCCMCLLSRRHKEKTKANPGVMWNQCLCLTCFLRWFGYSRGPRVIEAWKKCVFNYPLHMTGLQKHLFC